MKTKALICECADTAHQLLFTKNKDEPEIYISVHLNSYRGFFKRLVWGVKYIFGYKCTFGAFDEVITTAEELRDIINELPYKLTYEERIQWFIKNHYETGMEYRILLETMKDENLDEFKWYGTTISIPKYKENGKYY